MTTLFNLVLTHASTRNRMLRHTTVLSSLQHLVTIPLHECGETKMEGDKVCTTVGGISMFCLFYRTISVLITKNTACVAVPSVF